MASWMTGYSVDTQGAKEENVTPMPYHYIALAMKRLVLIEYEVSNHTTLLYKEKKDVVYTL